MHNIDDLINNLDKDRISLKLNRFETTVLRAGIRESFEVTPASEYMNRYSISIEEAQRKQRELRALRDATAGSTENLNNSLIVTLSRAELMAIIEMIYTTTVEIENWEYQTRTGFSTSDARRVADKLRTYL